MLPTLLLAACVALSSPFQVSNARGAVSRPAVPRTGNLRAGVPEHVRPNLLLILADDLGVDRVRIYNEDPIAGPTPVIDALAQQGVLFRNAWASPVCSSARATLLTGKHGYRTGVTTSIGYDSAEFELSLDETLLPEVLPPRYRSGVFGKWHLTSEATTGPLHPLLSGFDHHAGTIDSFSVSDGDNIYFDFEKMVDGVPETVTTYATTDNVDDALGWITEQDQPWFCYLSFNAPHSPFHAPPSDLISLDLPAIAPTVNPPLFMRAATEAMDREIGRLLQSIPSSTLRRTTVVFVGDNGTAPKASTLQHQNGGAKGTVKEGGINVPLIIAGYGVTAPGSECAGLVHTTDIFATLLELSGAPAEPDIDGVSMVPYMSAPGLPSIRPFVFSERRKPNGFGPYDSVALAVREERYKLTYNDPPILPNGEYRMYDLHEDPFEEENILLAVLHGPLTTDEAEMFKRLERVLLRRLEP